VKILPKKLGEETRGGRGKKRGQRSVCRLETHTLEWERVRRRGGNRKVLAVPLESHATRMNPIPGAAPLPSLNLEKEKLQEKAKSTEEAQDGAGS